VEKFAEICFIKMKISEQTHDIILELNEFSGSNLKNITDLSYIIEIASISSNEKLFYDLQFSAKYINGLSKILQSNISVSQNMNGFSLPAEASAQAGVSASDDEAKEKISKEFKENIMKFCDLLRTLFKHAGKEIRNDLELKYLSLTRDSMLNLNTLIYDLSWLKKYNNSLRT